MVSLLVSDPALSIIQRLCLGSFWGVPVKFATFPQGSKEAGDILEVMYRGESHTVFDAFQGGLCVCVCVCARARACVMDEENGERCVRAHHLDHY